MKAVVATGAIRRAKSQSECHHKQTNTQFFYRPDALPVTQPTVTCQSTEASSQTTSSKAKNKRVLVCIYIQNNPVTDSLCQRRRIREECFDQLLDGSPASFQNFRVHLLEQLLAGKLSENTRSQLGVSFLYLRMQTETAIHCTSHCLAYSVCSVARKHVS